MNFRVYERERRSFATSHQTPRRRVSEDYGISDDAGRIMVVTYNPDLFWRRMGIRGFTMLNGKVLRLGSSQDLNFMIYAMTH